MLNWRCRQASASPPPTTILHYKFIIWLYGWRMHDQVVTECKISLRRRNLFDDPCLLVGRRNIWARCTVDTTVAERPALTGLRVDRRWKFWNVRRAFPSFSYFIDQKTKRPIVLSRHHPPSTPLRSKSIKNYFNSIKCSRFICIIIIRSIESKPISILIRFSESLLDHD